MDEEDGLLIGEADETPEPTAAQVATARRVKASMTEALTQREFMMGERRFRIRPLPPLTAYDVLNKHVRPSLAAFTGVNFKRPGEAIPLVYSRIPYEHINAMGKIFRRHCILCVDAAGVWTPMASDINLHSQGLDPAEISFLDLRAFAVNFSGSTTILMREIRAIMGVDIESILAEQTDSSGSPSLQEPSHTET